MQDDDNERLDLAWFQINKSMKRMMEIKIKSETNFGFSREKVGFYNGL